jgi:uncharacterized protein RhaS with RHS repeats
LTRYIDPNTGRYITADPIGGEEGSALDKGHKENSELTGDDTEIMKIFQAGKKMIIYLFTSQRTQRADVPVPQSKRDGRPSVKII